MDFLQALQHIVTAEPNGAGVPVLLVNNKDAALTLSNYINMEGGVGYMYGPFDGADDVTIYEVDLRETAESADDVTIYEVDLRETAESPDEEPGADDNTYIE